MKRISDHRIWSVGVVVVAIALTAAACGSSGSDASGAKTRVKSARSTAPATLMVADSPLGKIVVDASGHTLYQFDHDTATTATCTAACANVWPAVIVAGKPRAGTGIDASMLGVLAVAGGSQLTYGGHPLYRYANDQAAGDTTGQGVGGIWWVVGADGQKVTAPAAAPTTPAPTTTPAAAPQTAPANTAPPETAPPETAPPATSPPETQPPATMPPATMPYRYGY